MSSETRPAAGRFVAIIPARGGSKGIPRKNLADLCGKPLIAYSIEAALACGRFARVVVSTDDEEIADVARACGAEVPVLRPRALATDKALPGEAFEHMLRHLRQHEGATFDGYVALYPTHPFRSLATMHYLLDQLEAGRQRVVTVRVMHPDKYGYFVYSGKAGLTSLPLADAAQLTSCVRPYGLFDGQSLHTRGGGVYTYPVTRLCSLIDIDVQQDLDLARFILQHRLWDPQCPAS